MHKQFNAVCVQTQWQHLLASSRINTSVQLFCVFSFNTEKYFKKKKKVECLRADLVVKVLE